MASKLGLILSLAFAIQVLCFMGDIACLQALVAKLDAASIVVSRLIAREGVVTTQIVRQIRKEYGSDVIPVTKGKVQIGETYTYILVENYTPISFVEPFSVTVTRSTVVGYLS